MPTKAEIVTDRKYLDSLQKERCLITGRYGDDNESVVPMHIGTAGKGLKNDAEALPVTQSLHARGHQGSDGGEVSMLRKHAPDWLIREAFRAYARELYAEWKSGRKA